MARRILQIIPAEGWLVVYDSGSGDAHEFHTRHVMCWALVEDDQGTRVVGLDPEHAAGRPSPGVFAGYARVGESLRRFERLGE
ncbi:MAG: hypothetical protein JNM07_01265 [Phycisphaerae bacterium]|nr:hypothetical protein [Phycisphaerae bacterium]